jgi:hypothetical protein
MPKKLEAEVRWALSRAARYWTLLAILTLFVLLAWALSPLSR